MDHFITNESDDFKDKDYIVNFIKNSSNFSLGNIESAAIEGENISLNTDDLVLLKIDQITFEEKAPRKEALENVLSSMRIEGINVFFIIIGNKSDIGFYYGISRDLIQRIDTSLSIEDIGDKVLKPSIEGNFRGSKVKHVSSDSKNKIISYLDSLNNSMLLQGVPGIIEDNEKYQSIDRLVDVMREDNFAYIINAKFLSNAIIDRLEQEIFDLYDVLLPNSKSTFQTGESHQDATTKNKGLTSQDTRTTPDDKDETRSRSYTRVDATNASTEQHSDGNNKSYSYELSKKIAREWVDYIDNVLLKRLDYGKGKGLFISNILLLASNTNTLIKLKNTAKSLFSGKSGNKVPLMDTATSNISSCVSICRKFQIPIIHFKKDIPQNEILVRTALSQYVTKTKAYMGNWYSVGELAIIAGLPQKEVIGLPLREEVEFGLNTKNIDKNNSIELGKLVQSGCVLNKHDVCLDIRDLDKHIFVAGVTGSGKTTTCQKLLVKSKLPFLVIEPVKTEYRLLKNIYPDLLVFTLGRDDIAPFRINPLEFFSHETISSHVDMVKASIESAFDMDAAIPQIIEKAIYECYEDFGWDLVSKQNKYYSDPYADGVYSFPTFLDLINKIQDVVESQGFDQRLKDEYIGSINARLQGLTVGSKGLMLCTNRSIDFKELIHKRIVLELDDIKSGSEKSLIMGFILSSLNEALRAEFFKTKKINDIKQFQHITLIEEAHRLLSKYEYGDSPTKKNSIEMFSDMLAEVRKYGECLIIADQIPSKLTPDVLKNTNTKIVHKIFAKDDKDAIGNAIALSEEQKKYLSFLDKGRAIFFSQGWDDSVQLQIMKETDTSGNIDFDIQEIDIKKRVAEYYCSTYKKGIINLMKYCKDESIIHKYFCELISIEKKFFKIRQSYLSLVVCPKKETNMFRKEILTQMKALSEFVNSDGISSYIFDEFYFENTERNVMDNIKKFIKSLSEDSFNLADWSFQNILTSTLRRKF